MKKYYHIAGVNLLADGEFSEYFIENMKEYECEPLNTDVVFKCNFYEHLTVPEGEKIGCVNNRHWLKLNDGGYASYDYSPELDLCLAVVTADESWSSIDCKLLNLEKVLNMGTECSAFNAFGEIFRFIMLKRNGIVIHSSSMAYQDQGILFSAPSETGKSTHTGLWKKYYPNDTDIINDDTPTIVMEEGTPVLCGTPWSGTSGVNMNKSVPLKAIVFIRRGLENTIKPLSPLEAITYISGEIRLPLDASLMDKTFDMINEIFKTVPCYILHCNISQEAVETVKNTVFK